jgi:hypothetical protein
MSTNDRPFTLGNTIYLKDDRSLQTLVHEMGHVWQFQNGGSEYALNSLFTQAKDGVQATYDWRHDVPQTAWEDLGAEKQAALLDAAFGAGYFNPASDNYGVFAADVNDDGVAEDLSDYLRRAVQEVREGRGAP